ncbi:hypothetical protein SAMN04487826_1397 [Prevotella sp. khp1]|nr:hypothetical protein SAMN04487826_1397 [Prevotella sp. khp1]
MTFALHELGSTLPSIKFDTTVSLIYNNVYMDIAVHCWLPAMERYLFDYQGYSHQKRVPFFIRKTLYKNTQE